MQNEHNNTNDNRIPARLGTLLAMKGIDITEHNAVRASGGGKCGAICLSLHTTGMEIMADEIRENINEHIVSNWNVYKVAYEFPYTD